MRQSILKQFLKKIVYAVCEISLKRAIKTQNLSKLLITISRIVPDISKQYTTLEVKGSYLETKVRGLHAFQILLAKKSIEKLGKSIGEITIVDIGDSSGIHLTYLKELYSNINALSVNLDPIAVQKIRKKGLVAIESKAELLHNHPDFSEGIDIFLSYEMLEHLLNPIEFLHQMSTQSKCQYFVITVPYLTKSRVGLHQIRNINNTSDFNAERTHIFELSSSDWDLIFRFSGWKIVYSQKYTQYPKKFPENLLKYLWRKIDFDGFYGVILQRDDSISSKYQDW
jgi:2-polyprenyl-3-methyl-5-hydroxy-6-metoxy-1,4-benzoquinol methylase